VFSIDISMPARAHRLVDQVFDPFRSIFHVEGLSQNIAIPGFEFVRQYPRQEPSAVVPLAGICAGGVG
jgi:hypothetical protein